MPAARRSTLFLVLFIILVTSLVVCAQVPLQFVPVTPCRVADTRLAPGPFGGPALQGQTSRDFTIPDGGCSIPSTAAAYSLNVTVVPRPTLGYLTVWPTGQPRPVLSTLNSPDGRVKANAAIVPAGDNQAISVYATDATDVVLDIDGYFAPASSSTLAFYPLTPCRIADTRSSTFPSGLGVPHLSAMVQRDFPVLSSPCIPMGITPQAYSFNFTAVPYPPGSGNPLGYLELWPKDQMPQNPVSTLNNLTGTVVANAAIVPAGTGGEITAYATNDTDLVIDIDGYFAPANSGPDPLSLYTLAPCRVLDTRHTTGAFSGMIPVAVLQSPCSVPSAQAYVLNTTVVPQNGYPLGYLTLWPDAERRPVVSTLNALDGAITSNMAIVPTLNGSIDAYATNPTNLVLDIFSYFAPITSLGITTTSLPSGTLSFSYNMTLGASGGVPPYTWSITAGDLPPGLDLDAPSGLISGIPTLTGTYPFTVQVADSQSPPATASAPLSITVNATLTQLTVVTTSLPGGTQNTTYNAMLAATGGVTPYNWSITAGGLPVGLHLNVSTGAITGTPSGAGISNFTVQVTDFQLSTASAPLSITIAPAMPLSITTTFLPSGNAGIAYSATLVAIGGVYPYTWSLTSGSLPNGLSLNSSTGTIAGTPTTPGTSNFTVRVADSETPPVTASAPLSITIYPPFTGILFYAPPGATSASGFRMVGTSTALYGSYSMANSAGHVAGLVKFDQSEHALGDWNNGSLPSVINAMAQDAASVYGCGKVPGSIDSAWVVAFDKNAPTLQPAISKTFQLNGKNTACYGVAVSGSQIYLAVRTDDAICGMAGGTCDYDRVVILDLQGNILNTFPVGNTPGIEVADVTKFTGIAISTDGQSIAVAGDRYDASGGILGEYESRYSLDGQVVLAGPSVGSDVGVFPIYDMEGNLYLASDIVDSPTNKRMFVMRVDAGLSIVYSRAWNGGNTGSVSVNVVTGVFQNPTGGITVVGPLSQLGGSDPSKTDGGYWQLDFTNCSIGMRDCGTIAQKRTSVVSGGTVSAWNSGFVSGSDFYYWGTGTDSSDGLAKAVLGKNQ
jgi:Putative Ig domain